MKTDLGRFHVALVLILGSAIVVGTCPILIMTFMNAPIDFWCARPDAIKALELNVTEWRTLSGQEKYQSCHADNVDFDSFEGTRRDIDR